MLIKMFNNSNLSEQEAYIVGLCFPKLFKGKYLNEEYILGRIGHHTTKVSNKEVTEDDILYHYVLIKNYLSEFYNKNFIIRPARVIQPKVPSIGFSLMFKMENDIEKYKEKFIKLLKKIKISEETVKKSFIKGMFDGRSSYDNGKYMTLDVDNNLDTIEIIKDIVSNIFDDVNSFYNPRGNDGVPRLRLSLSNLQTIKLFSPYRAKIITGKI